ncbi:MAG: hypothetical protein HYX50_03735 [Chloroflexi bacterium]|nr:hypothetical protein [Chloroflexota bacterium]
MIEAAGWIALALVIAFLINLAPAFMPSTWMVLAFFFVRFDLPLLPLTVSGAIVSGLGRLVLARVSGALGRRASGRRRDMEALGRYLDRHRRIVGPATFAYVLTPLPSNNLFIAAGMTGVSLGWVLAGFWAGRIIADTFWVWTTDRAFQSFGDLFRSPIGGPLAIALQLLSLLSVALLYRLPWGRWLRRLLPPTPQ